MQHVSRHAATLDIQDGDQDGANKDADATGSSSYRGVFNYKFYTDRQLLRVFMELFNLYKERNNGQGFIM